jgi:hypothetical protein
MPFPRLYDIAESMSPFGWCSKVKANASEDANAKLNDEELLAQMRYVLGSL